ncbi:hypothetical protein AB0L49_10630 [Streptomyces antimycoticus]|uniref:hypothetical protein n=1 Tax=Streptomyces antimycoticus TaxID=68175 RepID=UPI00341EDE69
MVLTIPLALLLAVVVALLLRSKAIGFGAAVAVALFGFYLADTSASDNVNQLVTTITGALAAIGR